LAAVSAEIRSLSDESLGNPGVSEKVQAVIGWYGPYDFASMDAQFKASGLGPTVHGGPGAAESLYLGTAVSQAPALVTEANPATYLSADDPPMLLQAGTKDSIVPVEQTINLAKAATRALGVGKVELRLIEDAAHGDPAFESRENLSFVLDWLDRILK
jgi:fermentation-respiration switch protein FrsA (DUF1100 family)